jgi:cellobiose phosphorylase
VEGILGLHKEEGKLRIDPCIPPAWKGFEAWVRMGAQHLHVVVANPDGIGTGIAAITLDGVVVHANLLQLDPDLPGDHEVTVRLGVTRGARQGLERA